jgi:tetratricopeptide (TPR) repeat protein
MTNKTTLASQKGRMKGVSPAATGVDRVDQFNDMMMQMQSTKDKWEEEDGIEDEQDAVLSQAIELAIQQGRGWGPGEKEAYLSKILDDDFIPPLFASTPDEVAKSGLQEAFTSLIYDENDSPMLLMKQFQTKGNDAYKNGVKNVAGNMQYYRDAVNHYYEAIAWCGKVTPCQPGDYVVADTSGDTYTEQEKDNQLSVLYTNAALAHSQLKNWGHARDNATQALRYNPSNVKAHYRLAIAHQHLQDYESAGNALDSGLKLEPNNFDLQKLQKKLASQIAHARKLRQQRERKRAERTAEIKQVWKHCNSKGSIIQLGRTRLVATVNDDDENDDNANVDHVESIWHNHLPHTGKLPRPSGGDSDDWTWPALIIYPSHGQSDFVEQFGESEMIALRLAEMFPELEEGEQDNGIPWDFNNEFVCSKLAVYFEVHPKSSQAQLQHPDSVELLTDQNMCIQFYESCRVLRGDEGSDMIAVVRAMERKRLYRLQKRWRKQYGNLLANKPTLKVVRIHPAVTLRDVLRDSRFVASNVSS